MQIGNRVKRNLSLTLSIVGLLCIASRIWDVVSDPSSGRAWFDLFGIIILTYLSLDNYMTYRSRVRNDGRS